MWIMGGAIKNVTTDSFTYLIDKFGAQSGSPVYTWYHGYCTVVGIHSYKGSGNVRNTAVRFTQEMISDLLEHVDSVVSFNNVGWPHHYIRCNPGANCNYGTPGPNGLFSVRPTENPSVMPPSGVKSTSTVTIQWLEGMGEFMYLKGEEKGEEVKEFRDHGFGTVYGTTNATLNREFTIIRNVNGTVSMESKAYPNCFIRLCGHRMKSPKPGGGGVVNCQWWEQPSQKPADCETFFMK